MPQIIFKILFSLPLKKTLFRIHFQVSKVILFHTQNQHLSIMQNFTQMFKIILTSKYCSTLLFDTRVSTETAAV